jgi:uncharacterized membrane protein YagU involved in acid resistance
VGGALRAILLGGLVAGALDFAAAVVIYHAAPLVVARSIASGWLGAAARTGGAQAAVIGVLSHFAIAIAAAGVYVAAVRRLPALKTQWIVGGLVFGLCVFAVMNAIVVPLSKAPPRLPDPDKLLLEDLAGHLVLVGLPIAWFARKA